MTPDGVFDLVPLTDQAVGDAAALETAVLASILSWSRAAEDDDLPTDDTDRQGWWADAWPPSEGDRWGCLIWLRARAVLTEATRAAAEADVRAALEWLIEDGICSAVEVTAARMPTVPVRLTITVTAIRADGTAQTVRAGLVWGST
jgi:phage gp46-like protein